MRQLPHQILPICVTVKHANRPVTALRQITKFFHFLTVKHVNRPVTTLRQITKFGHFWLLLNMLTGRNYIEANHKIWTFLVIVKHADRP